jgi:hypothetical protein
MAAKHTDIDDRIERDMAAVRNLNAERVTGRISTFGEMDEGTIFPDDTADMSGHVITEDGRLFVFWTTWDSMRARPTFATWEEVEDAAPPIHMAVEERQARAAVGLS